MSLSWVKPDDYHIRSACGKFSVSRMNVDVAIWYIAWRWYKTQPTVEIGATRVPITAPDSERGAAIKAMQQLCEAGA